MPLGLDCKLYRNTGTYGVPVWSELKNVKDVKTDRKKATADASTRGTGKTRAKVGTLREFSVSFESVVDNADADYIFLEQCYDNDTVVDMLVLNGPYTTPGVRGMRANLNVTDLSDSQPLENVETVSVTLEVAISANPPVRYIVS
jgi:hypothetical protein